MFHIFSAYLSKQYNNVLTLRLLLRRGVWEEELLSESWSSYCWIRDCLLSWAASTLGVLPVFDFFLVPALGLLWINNCEWIWNKKYEIQSTYIHRWFYHEIFLQVNISRHYKMLSTFSKCHPAPKPFPSCPILIFSKSPISFCSSYLRQ